MFDHEKTLEIFSNFGDLSERKAKKFLLKMLFDESFMEWLYNPKQVPNIAEIASALYLHFTKPKVMKLLCEVIEDEGISEFNRNHSTFLFSIANIAIETTNELLEESASAKKSGNIDKKELEKIQRKVEKYNDVISKMLKLAKKIVKRDAVELAKETNIPKYICYSGFHSVPDPKYINRYKVGFYLSNLLNTIYSEVEELGGVKKRVSEGIRWKQYFRAIFGKQNTIEVATFILLEGVHRIDNFKNSDEVKEIWDSLTAFALKELNEAPEELRSQMIELYIKRIDKMFSNRAFDLRVDITSLNQNAYPNLVKTVDKYVDKITSILTRKPGATANPAA